MKFDELIRKRVTTLKYTNKKISYEELEKIIECAIISPSAKNRQPWRFYMLTDKQKEEIANFMDKWINNTGLITTIKRSANIMRTAGRCILIYVDKWDCKHIDKITNIDNLLDGNDKEDIVVMHDYYFDRIKADILSCRKCDRTYAIKSY